MCGSGVGKRRCTHRFRGGPVLPVHRRWVPHLFRLVDGTDFHDPTLALTRTTDEKQQQSDVFAVPEEPGKYMNVCPIIPHGLSMRGFLIVK